MSFCYPPDKRDTEVIISASSKPRFGETFYYGPKSVYQAVVAFWSGCANYEGKEEDMYWDELRNA
jgi:hypothetical protein